MSWYVWSIIWWFVVGGVLAVATNRGEGWRKWWVRVAALLLSLTTVQQLGTIGPGAQLMTSAPAWFQDVATSLAQGCDPVSLVAQLACSAPVRTARSSRAQADRP
jgi:hypothetical protein